MERSFSDKMFIRDLPGEWRNLARESKAELVRVNAKDWHAYEKASREYERLEKLQDPNLELEKQIEDVGRLGYAFQDLQVAFRKLAYSFPPGSKWRKKILEAYRKSVW